MELYTATWDYLTALPTVQEWPELRDLFNRIVRTKPPHWWMAARATLATGGTLEQSIPAVVALGALYLNIILIDDMLDEDPRGQHHTLGIGPTANMSSALQALGYEAIARTDLPLATQAIVFQKLNQMMLKTTLGQYWDSQNPCDEADYWRVTRTKSSPYFGTSFFVGALFGGADEITARRLGEIGEIYGEMVQINDDLNDTMATPANADWLQGRNPLPILYATLVPHPEREQFIALRPQVGEEAALIQAQEILIRSGAISYGIDQLLRRADHIQMLLQPLHLAHSATITEMVDGILAPVRNLLVQMHDSLRAPSIKG